MSGFGVRDFEPSLRSRARTWLRDTINYNAIRAAGLTLLDDADAGIQALVVAQLAHWRSTTFDRSRLGSALEALSNAHRQVFVFDIRDGAVSMRAKDPVMPSRDPYYVTQTRDFFVRARRYQTLLAFVVKAYRLRLTTTLALDVNDYPVFDSPLPVFAFQNTAQSKAILLPDVDFITWDWYARTDDATPYDRKAVRAVFAGSSSGLMQTLADIVPPASPRLRAATYFTDHPNVDFRISRAVQCTPDAKGLLERQPYFKPELSWPQQWQNRFLISLDGNGATCSRVALSLKSQSALVKFASPFTLFYFGQLEVGREFLAVAESADVETILQRELTQPGHYQDIADAGRRFFRRFLDPKPLMAYTALLLKAYAALT